MLIGLIEAAEEQAALARACPIQDAPNYGAITYGGITSQYHGIPGFERKESNKTGKRGAVELGESEINPICAECLFNSKNKDSKPFEVIPGIGTTCSPRIITSQITTPDGKKGYAPFIIPRPVGIEEIEKNQPAKLPEP